MLSLVFASPERRALTSSTGHDGRRADRRADGERGTGHDAWRCHSLRCPFVRRPTPHP